jgi:hypothetical protein
MERWGGQRCEEHVGLSGAFGREGAAGHEAGCGERAGFAGADLVEQNLAPGFGEFEP